VWYIFDSLRVLTWASVAVRLLLATFCGGIIGIEREFKRRPAGFRTHILICLGAAMTTVTSQYLSFYMHYHTDIARLGAQVVAGMGFIGAGTIIVTKNQRVKGLTTAAGLWTTAIIGLSIGAGFFEGGLVVTLLVLGAELLLIRLEYRTQNNAQELNLFMEFEDRTAVNNALKFLSDYDIKVRNMQVTSSANGKEHLTCVILVVRLNKTFTAERLINKLKLVEGVLQIEEL